MRLTERLGKEIQDMNRRKKMAAAQEEEETMAYKPYPGTAYINERKDIFSAIDKDAINLQKSVFDRTALFHASREE